MTINLTKYQELFQGRDDAFALQQEDGEYRPIYDPLTEKEIIRHLDGKISVGLYTIRPGAVPETKLIVFDVDVLGDDKEARAQTARLQVALSDFGIWDDQYIVEFSGRKGYHIWLFLKEWMPASLAYKAARAVLHAADMDGTEAYPKQEKLVGKGMGNLVKLPFGIHRKSGARSLQTDGVAWERVGMLSRAQVEYPARCYKEPLRTESVSIPAEGFKNSVPCIDRIRLGVGDGMRDWSMYQLACFCNRQGMSREQAIGVLAEANDKFDPPLEGWKVEQKLASAYDNDRKSWTCSREHLHRPENLLCAKTCPRYKEEFGRATETYEPPAAPKIGWEVGGEVSVTVESVTKRGDGKLAVKVSHPDVTNTPVLVVMQ